MQLTIRNLTKTYNNGVKALDNLNLDISAGMFGLLGPNGAGKSSLMRTIATLQLPDSGSIQFRDIDVLEKPMQLRQVLGYLPQEFGVYPKVSAEKLLLYFATLKGIVTTKAKQQKVAEVLELTNLYDVRKKAVSGYSGGMRQRFGIAQLLLNDPQLIIVDEPTAGLDPAERNRFLNVLREIGTNNIVIFSTHLVDDVKELCTDLAIINKGSIIQKTTPSKAIQAIAGKIWTIQIEKAQLNHITQTHQVLSSSYNEYNSLTVRIFSNQPLQDGFQITKPNLEDVYFIALKNYE